MSRPAWQTELGKGQFSEVRYGLLKTNLTRNVAIKVINKAGTASSVRIAQEVQIMRHCNKMSCQHRRWLKVGGP